MNDRLDLIALQERARMHPARKGRLRNRVLRMPPVLAWFGIKTP